MGFEVQDGGTRSQRLDRLRNAVEGARAHVAERLGKDQVRLKPLEQGKIKLVKRPRRSQGRADGRIDFGARASRRDEASSHLRNARSLGRIIALVSYADKRAPYSQRKDDLRGAWKQRADPHAIHPCRNHEDRNHEEWIRGCQSWSIGLRRTPVEQYSSKCDDTGAPVSFIVGASSPTVGQKPHAAVQGDQHGLVARGNL